MITVGKCKTIGMIIGGNMNLVFETALEIAVKAHNGQVKYEMARRVLEE